MPLNQPNGFSEKPVLTSGDHQVTDHQPVGLFSRVNLVRFWAFPSLALVLIFLVSFHNLPLFHNLAEIFTGAIGLTMFVMAWYFSRNEHNHFLLFLGIGYGWIAGIDLAHSLLFEGVGLIPDSGANPSSSLWMLGRYLEALCLLGAPLFVERKSSRRQINAIFGIIAAAGVLGVFLGFFPTVDVEGVGPSSFKVYSQYIIILLFVLALAHIYSKRKKLENGLVVLVCLSVLLTISAQFTLDLHFRIDDSSMVAGHLLTLVSHWLLFVAIAQTMFIVPTGVLARNATVFENLPMVTVVVDKHGLIMEANMAARLNHDNTGGAGRSIVGKNCHEQYHHRYLSPHQCAVCKCIEASKSLRDHVLKDEVNGIWKTITLAPVDAKNPQAGMVHISRDISHRRSLEIEAMETRTSFELIVDTAPEAIISINAEQRIILFNKGAEHTFGYKAHEMIGKKLKDLLPEASFEVHERHVEEFLKSTLKNAPMRGDLGVSGRRKSGDLFPAEATILRQDRQQGTILTIVLRDISEQMERESKLRKSEERFRSLSEIASDWVWETDADLRYIYMSHQFYERLGMPKSIIGKTREEFAKPDPADKHWQHHLDDLANHREFRDFQYDAIGEHGREVFFSVSGVPQFNAEGEFTGYIGTGRDIYHLKESEREIERQRTLFETIVNGIPNALIFTTHKHQVIAANPGFEMIFGYSQEEIIGESIRTLFADHDSFDEFGKQYEISEMPMEESEFTILYRRKSGDTFPGKVVEGAVRDSSGDVQGYVILISDVSDQVMIEQQLRQSQKLEAIGQLTGGIAHDFNNLLTIIIGNLRFLEGSSLISDDPGQAELMEDTLSAAMDGAELTKRLLAFSSKSSLQPKIMALDEMIVNVLGLASRALREDIVVTHSPAGQEVGLFADKQQFESALLNILLNAQDAMQEGGNIEIKSFCLSVTAKRRKKYASLDPGKYAVVQVIDDGPGMSKEVLDKASEPFFTTKKYGHGTGLGLSTVLGFTRQSGGDFHLSSTPGQGTVAEMLFPYENLEAVSDRDGSDDRDATEKPLEEQQPLTILVSEDDDDVRKVIVNILKIAGHQVLEASSGEDAMGVIVEHPEIDVLVSDVIMPGGINGYQLADWVSKTYPNIRILMATGFDQPDNGDNRLAANEYPVLRKPFTSVDLITAVSDLNGG